MANTKLQYFVTDKGIIVNLPESRKYDKIMKNHGFFSDYDEDNMAYVLLFLCKKGDNINECLKELEKTLNE